MKTLFLSDIHLGANYIADHASHEKAVCRFLREEGADADHIYLLGDVLDYWYEYREVVPRGFVRFFGTLAALADSGVKITWLTGNHDIWLFGYLSEELGVEVIDAPFIERSIGGKNFILSHGDRLGYAPAPFRLISNLFRSRVCQKLYGAIHPRWTVPFAHRWSSNSRYSHLLADGEEARHRDFIMEDVEKFYKDYERDNPAAPRPDFIVMGHHHLIMDTRIPSTRCRAVVLGDWISNFSYAVFDGRELSLKTVPGPRSNV